MPPPSDDGRERAASDPGPPIHEDTGVLLYGLLLVALGGVGLATGQTFIVIPGDHGPSGPVVWPVSGPGGRVVAAGLLALGSGCVGRWRWGEWTRWPARCGLAGAGLVAVGLLAVGIARLLAWLA